MSARRPLPFVALCAAVAVLAFVGWVAFAAVQGVKRIVGER